MVVGAVEVVPVLDEVGKLAELSRGVIAPHRGLLDRTEGVFAFDAVEQAPTRAQLVEEVRDADCLVVCGHVPGSGIGRVVTREGRAVWEEVA